MSQNNVKSVISTLTILGAIGVIYISQHPFVPGINRAPHEALGQIVAEEAGKLLGSGGHLTLFVRDTDTFPNPASDAQLKAFQQSLKKAGHKVTTTHVLKMNPIGLMTVPPGDFFETIKKNTEADVIVSFLGPPALTDEQFAKLGQSRPKIVAVCSGELPARINLKQIFDEKLLHAAVLSRKIPPTASTPAAASPRELFEQWYWLATPANLADLPLPAGRSARKN